MQKKNNPSIKQKKDDFLYFYYFKKKKKDIESFRLDLFLCVLRILKYQSALFIIKNKACVCYFIHLPIYYQTLYPIYNFYSKGFPNNI